jgi:hypothetical protein
MNVRGTLFTTDARVRADRPKETADSVDDDKRTIGFWPGLSMTREAIPNLIPHDVIAENMTIKGLGERFSSN